MIHLHTHSMYSVLDGLSKVADIVDRAVELKAPAVAITDHASISCLPEFMKLANQAGVKPIIGCEFYITDTTLNEQDRKKAKRYHMNVWAKNWQGVESIMAQLSLANRQFYRRPVLGWQQIVDFKECMIGTACSFGILSHKNAENIVRDLQVHYGEDLYLEVMPHEVVINGIDIQKKVNNLALQIHGKCGTKILATNDSHYTRAEDAKTHNTLMAIQYQKKLEEYEGWPGVFFMRSLEEMKDAFMALPYFDTRCIREALLATVELASKVDIVKPDYEIHLPDVYDDDEAYAKKRIMDGWAAKIKSKVGANWKAYHERLIYELGVIKKMRLMKYFLMVEDVIRWSREQNIMVGPARGSAAGSLVCYLMDITQVDPIKHGLYFERFLNPDRVEMPDIDVDFADNRRSEVFDYVVNKYGRENVGQINTFSYLSVKSAFRDVSRTYGINNIKVNMLSRQIEDEESFYKVPELAAFAKQNKSLVETARKLSGTIRNTGVHACGCLIASRPLQEVCVLERRKGNVMVSNWDKRNCESFGLLKIDLLGLTTLSVLEHARQLVIRNYGVDIDYTAIPLDDIKTLEAFSRGECACIFQFEGSQMQQLLRDLKANDFETITATTALYRPGPLNSGLTGKYVKISQGRQLELYDHPMLEPILRETRSVLVYQEQIMRIFSELGFFTWAQADQMRKIIGKKLGKDEFDKHRERFMAGCRRNSVPDHVASQLFDQMAEFAAYSFNKSHAVAYTLLSYYSMFMKVHYTAEYLTARLTWVNSQERMVEAINEARRLKVPVSRPDINSSTGHYELDNGQIVAPLGAVKGVGDKAVEAILKARGDGVFLSVDDLNEKLSELGVKRAAHKGIIEKLARAGVFETIGVKEPDDEQRRKNYAELLPMFNDMPLLSMKRDKLDVTDLAPIYKGLRDNSTIKKRAELMPQTGNWPVIFAINMPVKKEKTLLSNEGTKLFTDTMSGLGITKRNLYYTSVIKELLDVPAKATKSSMNFGFAMIKEELKIIKPKLVICFAAQAIPLFVPDGKMNKLQGRVIYSKEYDCYVMFSYSPQYQYYQSDKAGGVFYDNMAKVRSMFNA